MPMNEEDNVLKVVVVTFIKYKPTDIEAQEAVERFALYFCQTKSTVQSTVQTYLFIRNHD